MATAGDPKKLPIRLFATSILAAVSVNDVVVVIGETGSGKTTQLSQILFETGYARDGVIAVTQPRRVGAVSVAKRVAEERGVELGTEVGYAVRFEDRTSADTKIKYLTDGSLLKECLEDPELQRYSVIILDEAHERSLNTDILFGVLKGLVRRRKAPLKLIVTSATLDGEKFSIYFGGCPVFNVPGRCFPVDIVHTKEDHMNDYVTAAIDTLLQVHVHQPPGDILVFLTGQAEIDKAIARINDAVSSLPADSAGPLVVLPLYASLPPDLQVRVFRPAADGVRRCIVATNVAETSITVEGVVYVIDSGVVKQKSYQPATGLDSLDVVPISRVQATQRAGRAGRTRPGKCFRLYTKSYFEHKMPEVTPPEVQRTSLVGAVLYLKSLQIDVDVLNFDFLDPPAPEALEDALRQLLVLDAITTDGEVTPLGKRMAGLPLDPSLARALLAARELGCVREMVCVAAMLSAEHIFQAGQGPGDVTNPQHRQAAGGGGGSERLRTEARERLQALMAEGLGDHVLLLRIWEGWEAAGCSKDYCNQHGLDLRGMNFARDVRRQLEAITGDDGSGLDRLGSGGENGGGAAEAKGRKRSDRDEPDREEGELPSSSTSKSQRRSDGAGPSRHAPGLPGGRGRGGADSRTVDALRHALTIGFANKLARRLPRHNGYKTLNGVTGQLAQLHPSCCPLREDADGLTPEFLVYHELVATSRPFLRQVCVTRAEWVQDVLPKLMSVDVRKLSGGRRAAAGRASHDGGGDKAGGAAPDQQAKPAAAQDGARRNDTSAVDAARARYLARKQQAGPGPGKHR